MRKIKIGLAKKNLILTLILFLISSVGYTQDSALRVEIKPEQKSVKNGEEVSVMTKIINTSHKDQHLQVWSCSYYDNWIVENPFVKLEKWPCNKNFITEVVLKPGKTYENKLSLRIDVPAEKILVGKVTFRLGFKTASGPSNPLTESPIIRSNSVTLSIRQ